MWVEEQVACGAAQARPGHHRLWVREDVPAHDLLPTRTPAALAAELAVECLEPLRLWFQDVLVPLNGFEGKSRVELLVMHPTQRV